MDNSNDNQAETHLHVSNVLQQGWSTQRPKQYYFLEGTVLERISQYQQAGLAKPKPG
jgi:hypothetical protein